MGLNRSSQLEPIIVGYDCLTPTGENVENAYRNIVDGHYGIRKLGNYPHDYIDIGGELTPDWRAAKELRAWTDPVSFLMPELVGRMVSKLNLASAFADDEVGIIAGSAFPGVTPMENLKRVGNTVKGLLCVTGSVPMARVLMKYPFHGEIHYLSTACATGGHAMLLARSLLMSQESTKLFLICCWDFPIIDIIMKGFQLSKTLFRYQPGDRAEGDPTKASRPMSGDRAGLVPSEGLAIMAVTSRATAERLNLPMFGVIGGAVSSGGAKSHVITDERSIAGAIRKSLAQDRSPEDGSNVDLISAHANSTVMGDAIEVRSLHRVFGNNLANIPVISTQEYFGHTFGASVILQAIMALEMMRRRELLPMRNYLPDPEMPRLRVPLELKQHAIDRTLVTGIGFGGASVSVVIRKAT